MADNFACRESRAVLDIDAGIAPAEEDPSSFIVGRREEVKTYVEAVGLSVILERRLTNSLPQQQVFALTKNHGDSVALTSASALTDPTLDSKFLSPPSRRLWAWNLPSK